MEKVRIDKWLWAARFYKTRSIAVDEIQRGRVEVGAHSVKPAREVHVGETITLWQGSSKRSVVVLGLSEHRGPAPVAQALYQETPDSVKARAALAEQRRLSPEPADAIRGGRPTKKDRRELQKDWGDRWSASLD